MEYDFIYDDSNYNLKINGDKENYLVTLNANQQNISVIPISPNVITIKRDNNVYLACVTKHDEKYFVHINGSYFEIKEDVCDSTSASGVEVETKFDGTIRTPMPGKVVKVLVEEGQKVTNGDVVIIIEAMKMEHSLTTASDGIVKKIHLKEGEQTEFNATLIEIDITDKE